MASKATAPDSDLEKDKENVSSTAQPIATVTDSNLIEISNTSLDEDDYLEVIDAVCQLQDRWSQFCCALGLPLSQISAIRKDHAGNTTESLQEGISQWLQGKYNTEKYGVPTWKKLVAAIDNPVGGNNHDLAVKISLKHKEPVLRSVHELSDEAVVQETIQKAVNVHTKEKKEEAEIKDSIATIVTDKQLAEVSNDILGEDDFSKVIGAVSQLSDKWRELCHALGIPLSTLSAIRKDHTGDNIACLHEGLSCWLLGKYSSEKSSPPTWRKLVAAVDSICGGAYHHVALKIAKEHKESADPKAAHYRQRTITEDIGHFIDLGLGRGVDATDLTPWLNRSAFQVRHVTNANIIGTEEGDLLKGFVNEVESVQHLQASLRASVPASELVSIGIDSELSRKYSESQKSVGKKIITRTIAFRAGFKDIDDGKRIVRHDKALKEKDPSKTGFEGHLVEWIDRKVKEKETLREMRDNRHEKEELNQKVLTNYCYEFIKTFSVTHYVHSLELGASYYHVLSEKDYETKVSSKVSVAAGQAGGGAVSTQGKFSGRKLQSEATLIGRMSKHTRMSGNKKPSSKTVSVLDSQNLTVRRSTLDEAVVGVKLQSISSLVVRNVLLRDALKDAIQKYIDDHQNVRFGPFIISCNRDRVYLKVSTQNEEFEVQATQNIEEASKFFVIRLDERNYFNIVYEYSSERDVRRQLERKCGRSKPAVSMYLCAPVNWRGKMQRNKPLRMQLSGKTSRTRMALHSRKSKNFQPVKLTEWIGEKEVFFISCQERSVSKLKGSYLCVYEKNPGQTAKLGTTENAPPDDKSPIQREKPNEVPAEKPDDQENEPQQELTGVEQGEPNNSENTITTQGQETKAENQIENVDSAEVDTGTDSKSTTKRRKAAKKNEQDESEPVKEYQTGCVPDIKKHNDKEVFMLFRLLKPDLQKQGAKTDDTGRHEKILADYETPVHREIKERTLAKPPENTSLHTALQNYAKNVLLLLHTCDYDEWSAVCASMQGVELENVEESISKQDHHHPLRLALNDDTDLVIGEFGGYGAALIYSDDECTELKQALDLLSSIKCVVSIGTIIAFNRKSYKLGDVVVSDCIDGITEVQRSDTTKLIKFSQHDTRFTPVSQSISSIFKGGDSWEGFECTKQRGRKSKVYHGTIMSMPYDVFDDCCDHKVLELPCHGSTYIGVEYNGAPILQTINRLEDGRKIDVILVEGVRCYVSDYRNYKKIWKWQTTACMAATDYAKYKLEHSSESQKYFKDCDLEKKQNGDNSETIETVTDGKPTLDESNHNSEKLICESKTQSSSDGESSPKSEDKGVVSGHQPVNEPDGKESDAMTEKSQTSTTDSKEVKGPQISSKSQESHLQLSVRHGERTISEEEIDNFIDLGLGRGVDATNPTPWLNKSAFQVRKANLDNVIGTEEGNLFQSFVNEVESTQHLQTSLSASIPASQLVSIGMDSELSRGYSVSQKSVGRKIVTRTISFRAGFDDISDGTQLSTNASPEKEIFENQLFMWIFNKLKERYEFLDDDDINAHLWLFRLLRQDELTDYCYKFVKTFSITHYVHTLELGASYYQVMSSKKYETKVSNKTKVMAGNVGGASIGTEGIFGGRKLQSKITMIGHMREEADDSGDSFTLHDLYKHGGADSKLSPALKSLTVDRHTMDEAVVGVKLQPISSLVVKEVRLREALLVALQKFIQDHQNIKFGPFFITCNRERLFLTVDNTSGDVEVSESIKEASKFFIVRCDEGDNHFNIVYEARSVLGDQKKSQFDKEVGKHKPPVPMYLCVPVNWRGQTHPTQSVQMLMNGKASQSQMALHSRRSKTFQPAKLTEWINEKEVFFVNCKERTRGQLKKSSYLCVRKDDKSKFYVGCEPSIKKHDDKSIFMLFRLLKPKDKDSTDSDSDTSSSDGESVKDLEFEDPVKDEKEKSEKQVAIVQVPKDSSQFPGLKQFIEEHFFDYYPGNVRQDDDFTEEPKIYIYSDERDLIHTFDVSGMSADMIVEELASKDILKRKRSKPTSDAHDDETEENDGKVQVTVEVHPQDEAGASSSGSEKMIDAKDKDIPVEKTDQGDGNGSESQSADLNQHQEQETLTTKQKSEKQSRSAVLSGRGDDPVNQTSETSNEERDIYINKN